MYVASVTSCAVEMVRSTAQGVLLLHYEGIQKLTKNDNWSEGLTGSQTSEKNAFKLQSVVMNKVHPESLT
jgi:hypothetical protein